LYFFYRSLAAAAGHEVTAGETVRVNVDLMLAHDGTAGRVLDAWDSAGKPELRDGERLIITLDHQFPAPGVASRLLHRRLHEFADSHGVRFYQRGEGVLHQVVAEEHKPRPGMIIAGADGHVATAGAFGSIAFSLKPEEMITVMSTGALELKIPEILGVRIDNRLPGSATPRDLALVLAGLIGGGAAQGKAVMIWGEGAWALSDAGRMTLCNMLGETGAVTGLIIPEAITDYLPLEQFVVDAGRIEPVVACPPAVTNVRTVKECAGLAVEQVVVGGCSSGRLEDMEELCRALNGRPVHPSTHLVVTPASRTELEAMDESSISRMLRHAGAVINPPGCGPCPGLHQGIVAPGDRVLATIVRNSPGRMGAPEAEIYLCSPRTAGLAAATGAITAE
jgi:3-isopropylmalate/(R)-2-methylmalate dehydratase large subunit